MRILTPTDNKRLNELVGFIGISLAVLLALSLLSYSPHDSSFNVSSHTPGSAPSNWIGPVGAHLADLFFQGFGFSAFLLPVGIFLVAMRWFRTKDIEAPVTKTVGSVLLVAAVAGELALLEHSFPSFVPEVRGALPTGGLLGGLLAEALARVSDRSGRICLRSRRSSQRCS